MPQWLIPRPEGGGNPSKKELAFSYTSNPFGFAVTRLSDQQVLFNTSVPSSGAWNGLQFNDQFLSVSTQLAGNTSLYGLGESTQSNGFKLTTSTFTLWNHDTPCSITNQNLYGSHPFYMEVLPNGNAHGAFLLNSNGMDVIYKDDHLTYNVIGGVLDFYFFSGPTPDNVVQQYQRLVGLPHMQPYWAYGFHQCRYGMPDLAYVEGVVANYSAADIPLDTIWGDIDYMDEYKDFTWDPVNYPVSQIQSFTEELHQNHQQYVVIVDPGILNADESYKPYTDLISNSAAYIKDSNGDPFIGQVWPGYTLFPDFLSATGQNYWDEQLRDFLGTVPYDGLWIDMNEASNFCSGQCLDGSPIPLGSTTCGCEEEDIATSRPFAFTDDYYASNYSSSFDPNNPPYAIDNNRGYSPLNNKAIDMDAFHIVNGEKLLEYDVHNMLGLSESRQTRDTLQNVYNKRSFVLTRSSFPSSGKWAAKWTGDNESTWPDLYYSIVGMLNSNLLGIPMIGADICGFNGNTTEELCARWIELGAFYPFSRNHNAIGEELQELYRWTSVSEISSFILRVRYSLLPLYYTLNFQASVAGGSIARPLFFQFPSDPNLLGLDTQFLIGSSLMVAPVLTEGATSVSVYFPKATWYDLYSNQQIVISTGTRRTIQAPLEVIPLYLLGGSALVRRASPQLTTYETNQAPYNLTVAYNSQMQAQGDLFVDDGSTLSFRTENLFVQITSSVQNGKGTLTSHIVHSSLPANTDLSTRLESILFLGVTSAPTTISINGQPFSSFQYNQNALSLVLTNLALDFTSGFKVSFA